MDIAADQPAGSSAPTAYLNKKQFVARTGLSAATVQRYKDGGKIPFFQPAGPGGKLLFPSDAIEAAQRLAQSERPTASLAAPTSSTKDVRAGNSAGTTNGRERLCGPKPRWRITAASQTNR
jgi:hypothetical protein